MVRSAIAAIERRRETLRLKYIRRADVLVLVYNPTDEDSVRATLTCLDSRTKISTEKIVLIFENLRRGVSKNATRDDKPAPYYRSLRFFCPYENVDFGKTMTSFEMSTPRLVGKRPSFDTVRYFYSCDLTDPSSGTIVRDAIRVAMKRVILGRYVLTGWSPEVIRDAIQGLNAVSDCCRNVEDTAATNDIAEDLRNDLCDDGKFIPTVSVQVPSWQPRRRRFLGILRAFFSRIVKLLRRRQKRVRETRESRQRRVTI